jgi:arginine decarboxylase-like protein
LLLRHAQSAANVGKYSSEILNARAGKSESTPDNAIATFAVKVNQYKGLVNEAGLAVAQEAGLDDGVMSEIVANISLNTVTNYCNRLADEEIDCAVVHVEL